jgi:NAD(P)-dependent dehydrogenase (short-subunit alcohol dehydrogenase family)
MTASFSLAGRVAVVTGAAGLLGQQHCKALASAGARVVAADLDVAACHDVAADLLAELGAEVFGHGVDVTEKKSVAALRDAALARFGQIDVLVNNAALNEKVESTGSAGDGLRFENYALDLWERSLKVNLTGVFLCSQVLGSEMARRGTGSIVNIASTYGMVGPDQSLYRQPDGSQTFFKSAAYPTTKGGVLAFTRFLAAYWGRNGIRVNALSPGGVENGQDAGFIRRYADRTPLGCMARPTDYGGALVFLAGDASAYMTGANLVVDGGYTAW